MMNKYTRVSPGIPDHVFIRGQVPMTKEEVRILSISKLNLNEDSVLLDVGAGTGSVAIEAGLLLARGSVIAVEKSLEGINLIRQNCIKFGTDNIRIIHGKAPDCFDHSLDFNRVFIGGSDGELEGILRFTYHRIQPGGTIVINAVTLETLSVAKRQLGEAGFESIEVICVNISKSRAAGQMTMMEALNPVYILSAQKGGNE